MSLHADSRRTYIGLVVVAGLCLTFAGCFVVSRSNAPSSTVLIPATPATQPNPAAAPAPDADEEPSR